MKKDPETEMNDQKERKTVAKLLRELKGVGEKTEKLFQKIGITTTDDLLHYYPRITTHMRHRRKLVL